MAPQELALQLHRTGDPMARHITTAPYPEGSLRRTARLRPKQRTRYSLVVRVGPVESGGSPDWQFGSAAAITSSGMSTVMDHVVAILLGACDDRHDDVRRLRLGQC